LSPGHSRSGPTERYEYERKLSYISYWNLDDTKKSMILLEKTKTYTYLIFIGKTVPSTMNIKGRIRLIYAKANWKKTWTAQSKSDWLPVTLL